MSFELAVVLFVVGVLGLGWASVVGRRVWRELLIWHRVRRIAPTPIAALRPGTVVVRGRACRVDGVSGKYVAWENPKTRESGCVPFTVEDESGTVRVECDSVRLAGAHHARGCRVLYDGERVAVLGVAEDALDPSAAVGYREAPTRMVLRAGELMVARPTVAVLLRTGEYLVQVLVVLLVSLLAVGASLLCVWFLLAR